MGWRNTRTILEMTKLREELANLNHDQLKEHPEIVQKLEKYEIQTDPRTADIKKVLEEIDGSLAEKMQARQGPSPIAHHTFLSKMTTAAVIGIVSLLQVAAQSGIGQFPQKDRRFAQKFSFELVMHLTTGLEAIKETFRHIARASGADKKTEVLAAEALALVTLVLTLFAAGQDEKHDTVQLVEQMKPHIEPGIDALEELVNEKAFTGTEEINVLLQQGKLALQHDNFDGFINTCYGALELLKITPDQLVKDLEKLNQFASAMAFALTTGLDDQTNTRTGIAQA